MEKLTKPFIKVLAIVSILGFTSIALDAFGKIDIQAFTQGLMFIILGIGLTLEGNIRGLLKYIQNGFTKDEVSHITAVVIGVASVVIGIMMFFWNPLPANFESVKGLIAVIAIVVIAIESFLVK